MINFEVVTLKSKFTSNKFFQKLDTHNSQLSFGFIVNFSIIMLLTAIFILDDDFSNQDQATQEETQQTGRNRLVKKVRKGLLHYC